MKINVIGGPGSGKTTLAKQISEKHNLPIIHSDSLVHKYKRDPATLVQKVEEEISYHINWIYEGRHLFDSVLEQADEIIWVNISLTTCLYRQWQRYFTDAAQRKEYGFKNNVSLSKMILKEQYLGEADEKRVKDPLYSHNKKVKKLLEPHKHKVTIFTNNKEIAAYLSSSKAS